MKKGFLKTTFSASLILATAFCWAQAQDLKIIKLLEPNKKRGLPLMEALSVRASVREWSDQDLNLQDLSDLLWAANGINRPDSGKRTASSAMNAQDVDIYVFMKDGVYLYDAGQHALNPVASGDHRAEITARPAARPGGPPAAKPEGQPAAKPETPPEAKRQGPAAAPPSPAPVQLILISDTSRFSRGTPEQKYEWACIDTGIVSQNISLFCAATGLATRPRASINKDLARILLKLKEAQFPILNHPLGYPKKSQ
jgi:nitroreductase